VKPDTDYASAVDRWDRVRTNAAGKEMEAGPGSLAERYWRNVGVTAERHLDELLQVGPPDVTGLLPSEEEQ
jgi:hypothetical protein